MITVDGLVQKRLSKTHLVGRMLARLPFVRAVILNGSLVSGNHKPSSDIDILIIAKDGRIFTARFFVNIFATLVGIKRSKDDKSGHAGKFCFNYFLTEHYLHINYPKEREQYCAGNYSKSQFVAGDVELFKKFMKENEGLFEKYNFKYQISNIKYQNDKSRYNVGLSSRVISSKDEESRDLSTRFPCLPAGRSALYKSHRGVGMTKVSDWFEKWAKEYQIKKIESDPRTKEYPDMIVYNDRELRFHPPKG